MSEERSVTQRRFGARVQFQFRADRLNCTLRDHSGELNFLVPYEAIDIFESSTLVVNNFRLLRITSVVSLLLILVLGSVAQSSGLRSAGIAVIVGVWVGAIVLVRLLGLLAIRYTLLPVTAPPGRKIRIMAGRDHDAILDEIKARWRERVRKLHGSINFGNDAEKELAKFAWLKRHNVITEDEFGAISERLRANRVQGGPQQAQPRLN